jgi:hypothetical protein
MRAWMLTLAAAVGIAVIAPGAARAASDLELNDIVPGTSFTMPVDVTAPPEDPSRVFVVQQDGRVLMVKDGIVSTFLDLSSRVNVFGEEGLMSIAFAPDFATSGLFYVFYSDASHCTGSSCDDQVDEFHATPDLADSSTRRPVITIPHQAASGHHGGTLRFGADGLLYISTGDAQTPANGEDTTLLNGKILRIDPRAHGSDAYSVPSDNPFVGQSPAQPEIWASGLRNPWRFSFDSYTGDLVVPDVGEHTREEINLVPGGNAGGKDFEWSTCEGEFAFPPTTPPTPCPLSGPGYVSPVLTYGHDETEPGDGCGPSGGSVIGGVVVRDRRLPATYFGRYMYGDYCHRHVWTADLEAGSLAAVHGTIQDTGFDVGSGVTSIDRDAACRIYVTHSSGWVRRVDPVGAPAGPVGCATPPPPPPPPDGGGTGGSQPETTPAPPPRHIAVVVRTRPVLGRVDMVRTRFAVGEGPTAISAVGRGTAFRFMLSKAGVVTIRIARARLGRRAGRRCLGATRARRRLPGCTRLVAAGTLSRRLAAGRRSVPFSGRIGRRPLEPGRYRATLTARDTAGNVSHSQTLSFTIVAG